MLRYISRVTRGPPVLNVINKFYSYNATREVAEVSIPMPWGHIAGKWWNSKHTRPIIALHGWLDNCATYDTLIPLLPPEMSVLAVDCPGHGKSSHLPQGSKYIYENFILMIKRIADHFGWKNVSLMGHSMGGQGCFLYTAIYPHTVDSLVLLDILTMSPTDPEKYVRDLGKNVDGFLKYDKLNAEPPIRHSFDKLLERVVKAMNGSVTEEVAKILLSRGATRHSDGNFSLNRDLRLKSMTHSGMSEAQILELCGALETNVLFIKAESSSWYMKKEFVSEAWDRVKSVAPTAKMELVPGKHHVHLQTPDVVAPLITEFFQTHRKV